MADYVKEYVNMWKNYANFSDRTTVRGYWMAVLVNFIIGAVAGFLLPTLLTSLYSLAILIPGISISVRRLRDAGKEWTNIFWALLPLVGWIIVIYYLCRPSVPADGVPVV